MHAICAALVAPVRLCADIEPKTNPATAQAAHSAFRFISNEML